MNDVVFFPLITYKFLVVMTDIPHSNATLKIIIFTSFMLSLPLFYHAYSHLCSSTLNVFSLFFSVDYDNLPKVDVSISLSLTAK